MCHCLIRESDFTFPDQYKNLGLLCWEGWWSRGLWKYKGRHNKWERFYRRKVFVMEPSKGHFSLIATWKLPICILFSWAATMPVKARLRRAWQLSKDPFLETGPFFFIKLCFWLHWKDNNFRFCFHHVFLLSAPYSTITQMLDWFIPLLYAHRLSSRFILSQKYFFLLHYNQNQCSKKKMFKSSHWGKALIRYLAPF